MAFEQLIELIHSGNQESWKERNDEALTAMFASRYHSRARDSVTLRAPEMKGGGDGVVPYAAYIHPSNPDSGAYAGMSFVIFPARDEPCLIGMVIGTQGLSPDEAILGRPGHARKMQAICRWLNNRFGSRGQVAWAKQDPTRTDISVPAEIRSAWSAYDRVFQRYGGVLYALYRPSEQRDGTLAAVTAMLDVMFEERGYTPLTAFQPDWRKVQQQWFAHLMPAVTEDAVVDLLTRRRYVVLQGPPGTGKTRMAGDILANHYRAHGSTIQFHANTTYENFIGGLGPVSEPDDTAAMGLRFAPIRGALMKAAKEALSDTSKPYLLLIDEINRADLAKILGEALYLLEPDSERERRVSLPYDFGEPFHREFWLPANLHILGTMNSSDRSIAIVDVAVRRRFGFVSLWPDLEVVERLGCAQSRDAFQRLVAIFLEHASEDALCLVPGHSYFLVSDSSHAKLHLQSNLCPLLQEYLAQGYVSGFAESIRAYLQWLESL